MSLRRPATAKCSAHALVPRQRRILVVDDDPDAGLLLAMLLRRFGYDAKSAVGGPEALQTAVAWCPDVAVLDLEMPGMSGYELAARLRVDPTNADLVLLAFSGSSSDDARRRTRSLGFDDHLVKGVDLEFLIAALGPATSLRPRRHTTAA